jgi:hypothetical protein
MEKEEKMITLKEAATISGYSSDYIGQLIRSGKLYGKQVYCNVAWMTTKEAILAYKNGETDKKTQKEGFGGWIIQQKRKFIMEMEVLKLVYQSFKSILPLIIILTICICALAIYLFVEITPKLTGYSWQKIDQATDQPFSY